MTAIRHSKSDEFTAVVGDYDGSTLSYGDLERQANQFARYLRDQGVRQGSEVVAVLMDNDVHFYAVLAGIERSGMSYASVNYDLTPEVISYIVRDAQPAVLVTTPRLLSLATEVAGDGVRIIVVTADAEPSGELPAGAERYHDAIARMPASAVPDGGDGGLVNYTSGSTGLPKSIRYDASDIPFSEIPEAALALIVGQPGGVYLVPSPLYHNLPGIISTLVHRRGGTVVVLRDFAPEHVLASIERYGVTHTMIPPSLLTALSKLPAETKQRYRTGTLRGVLHDAAPCAPVIKQAMIDWWGPILNEFYGASDVGGFTLITGQEWTSHPGSVGRPLGGVVEIRGADGSVLPSGHIGAIWLGGSRPITPSTGQPTGAAIGNTGDIGYVDTDGYLFHVDRKSNVVSVEGHDYYPQQIEHALIGHPDIADVVVLGGTDADQVALVAVVQPMQWPPKPGLGEVLLNFFAQGRRSQVPLVFEFVERLPRAATGKLYRNQITLD